MKGFNRQILFAETLAGKGIPLAPGREAGCMCLLLGSDVPDVACCEYKQAPERCPLAAKRSCPWLPPSRLGAGRMSIKGPVKPPMLLRTQVQTHAADTSALMHHH